MIARPDDGGKKPAEKGSIEIPFAIGSTVWWTGNASHKERKTCPECAGTKALTLIKGNGEEVSLACDYCRVGFNEPRGWVEEWDYAYVPTEVTLRRVEVRGSEIRYSTSPPDAGAYMTMSADDLFSDRDECAAVCEQKTRARRAEMERREDARIASKRRSLAHSTHYWKGQVDRLKEELRRAEARLQVAKDRKASKGIDADPEEDR